MAAEYLSHFRLGHLALSRCLLPCFICSAHRTSTPGECALLPFDDGVGDGEVGGDDDVQGQQIEDEDGDDEIADR